MFDTSFEKSKTQSEEQPEANRSSGWEAKNVRRLKGQPEHQPELRLRSGWKRILQILQNLRIGKFEKIWSDPITNLHENSDPLKAYKYPS